jgi:hypothetical protein
MVLGEKNVFLHICAVGESWILLHRSGRRELKSTFLTRKDFLIPANPTLFDILDKLPSFSQWVFFINNFVHKIYHFLGRKLFFLYSFRKRSFWKILKFFSASTGSVTIKQWWWCWWWIYPFQISWKSERRFSKPISHIGGLKKRARIHFECPANERLVAILNFFKISLRVTHSKTKISQTFFCKNEND